MSDFVFEILNLNTDLIKLILALVSKGPEFSDYASYRGAYLIPLFIAFVRNKSNFRLIFLCNLILGFIGISIVDFFSKTQGLFIYTLFSFIYFLPIFIALLRNTYNLHSIFVCNIIFGFTGISWFVILFWAFVAPENKPAKKPDGELCPRCKELIRAGSKVCHHCHSSL